MYTAVCLSGEQLQIALFYLHKSVSENIYREFRGQGLKNRNEKNVSGVSIVVFIICKDGAHNFST
jgi:hypothetical protein